MKPTQVDELIADFLATAGKNSDTRVNKITEDFEAEVRIGLGSCCVAGGSREILSGLMEIKEGYDLNIKLKTVGCVGVCNQTPLLEVVTGKNSFRYTNVRKDQVEGILLRHVKPRSLDKRLRYKLNNFADTFLSDDLVNNPANIPGEIREKYLNNFLSLQVHLATLNSGIISPDSN